MRVHLAPALAGQCHQSLLKDRPDLARKILPILACLCKFYLFWGRGFELRTASAVGAEVAMQEQMQGLRLPCLQGLTTMGSNHHTSEVLSMRTPWFVTCGPLGQQLQLSLIQNLQIVAARNRQACSPSKCTGPFAFPHPCCLSGCDALPPWSSAPLF